MTMITPALNTVADAYDRLVEQLEAQFGHVDRALAERYLEAEQADFHWESRTVERHLGRHEGGFDLDDEGQELDRIAIAGTLKGRWFTAICIVDGEGAVHDMASLSSAIGERQARWTLDRMR